MPPPPQTHAARTAPADAAQARSAALRAKRLALELGFDLAGVARVEPLDPGPLDRWLAAGYDAGMHWMRSSRDQRVDPLRIVPGLRSVVALAVSYEHEDPPPPSVPAGRVARYAQGRDYHNVMRRPLNRLRDLLQQAPGARAYTSCDVRPVMEKVWAQKAGLGWIGKNGCLIAPPFGSRVLLGCVFTTVELEPDEPHPERCGTCTACLSSCPTDAIPEPGVIDAGRCISYHTIEHRDPVPPEIAARLGGRLFGCDECQDVCPWNRKAQPPRGLGAEFRPRGLGAFVPLKWLRGASDAELESAIHGTPLMRAGLVGLRRTARALDEDDS